MQLALDEAGLNAGDIAHINAHGTSTPLNDAAEAEAISKMFGSPGPAVTSIKGVTGHALGAAPARSRRSPCCSRWRTGSSRRRSATASPIRSWPRSTS